MCIVHFVISRGTYDGIPVAVKQFEIKSNIESEAIEAKKEVDQHKNAEQHPNVVQYKFAVCPDNVIISYLFV